MDLTPAWATLYPGQQQQFAAVTANVGTGINWSIDPPNLGSISGTGLNSVYTAPASIAGLQSVIVKATSASNPSLSGSTTVYSSGQPFAILVQKPSVFVAQGASAGVDVAELATDGFPHPVEFSVSGLPSGVTAAFSNPSLTGTGATTLTVSSSAGAATGSYVLTVTATDTVYAPLSRSAPLTLVVGSGFALSASSSTVTAPPGGSVAVLITEAPLNGFDLPVMLSASASSGIAAIFPATHQTTQLMSHPGNAGLLLTVPGGLPPGAYPVTVSGEVQTAGSRASVSLTVIVSSPAGPAVASMTPNPGTQTTQVLSFQVSDSNGIATLTSFGVLVNSGMSTANGCYLSYSPAAQTISLRNDADTGWAGSATVGNAGTLRNSQCIVDTGAVTAAVSGAVLTFSVALTPVSPAIGSQSVYVTASDPLMTAAWRQIGVWTISAGSLPADWRDQEVGVPGYQGPGGSTYTPDTGLFHTYGFGNNADSPPDAFHFTYQPLTGDGSITARLTNVDNTFPTTSAGVMIRAAADPGSAYVYLSLQSPTGGCLASWRTSAGAAPVSAACGGGVPIWLRVVRAGSTFSMQTSANGSSWTGAGSPVTANLPATLLYGLAVTSGIPNALSSADFDHAAVAAAPAAAPAFSPGAGNYTSAQSVTLSTATSGASIRYTTDGTTPTNATGTMYAGPVSVSATTTLKAIAFGTGLSDSTVSSAVYNILAAAPTFSPVGGSYSGAQVVTIASTTGGAAIRFTTDGTAPSSTSGTPYTAPIPIAANTTLKAVAYMGSGSGIQDSAVASASYAITLPADLVLSSLSLTGGAWLYQAANTVRADAVTIGDSASIAFQAGQTITLQPGFRATAGAAAETFRATVQ